VDDRACLLALARESGDVIGHLIGRLHRPGGTLSGCIAELEFAADTSGLAADYILYSGILYSGLEVLPIGGYLGNVPSPTLATLQADINSGYVVVFVLPVSPPGSDSRVRWLESHCFRELRAPNLRPIPYASFVCGGVASEPAG
jgi:hypothetical protein